jgi:hypothetical protein
MTIRTNGSPSVRGHRTKTFACLAVIAALAAILHGCGSGILFPSGFAELLFTNDGRTVNAFSVDSGVPTMRGSATIPGVPGTYDRAGNLVTISMPKHQQQDSFWVTLDFGPGAGGTATSGTYLATVVDNDTFTINDTASGAITGGTLIRHPDVQLAGTYSQTGTTITVNVPMHHLGSDWGVKLHITSGTATDLDTTVSNIVDADNFTVTSGNSASASGNVTVIVGANYIIFGMAMHPSGNWVYATSGYDCYVGSPYCWGADLISRFRIDWTTGALTFEQSFRTTNDNVSDPIPVTIAFTPDGLHMIHQDDDLDGLRLWDVNPLDGDITLVANSGQSTTYRHGIGILPDGTRVYDGSRAFMVAPGAITPIAGGTGGEADQISTIAGVSTLFAIIGGGSSTGPDAMLEAFSLTNPDSPALIATGPLTPNNARDFAMFQSGALLVVSGYGGLKSYTFNGTTIAPAVGAGNTELIDGGGAWPTNSPYRIYRSVSPNAAGNMVVAGYFTHDDTASAGGLPPSGFLLANVAADGSLSPAFDYSNATYTRVARFFQKP